MAAATFAPADEVKSIANDLIPLYHPHLLDARVDYVFISKTKKKGSKEVWGEMRKISNLNAYLAGDQNSRESGCSDPFFVMTISEPVWNNISNDCRRALVDHELCHAKVEVDEETGDYKLHIEPHDVEDFTAVIERHGLWTAEVKKLLDAARAAYKKGPKISGQDEAAA